MNSCNNIGKTWRIQFAIELLVALPWILLALSFLGVDRIFPAFPISLFILLPTGLIALAFSYLSVFRQWEIDLPVLWFVLPLGNVVIGSFAWMLLYVVAA